MHIEAMDFLRRMAALLPRPRLVCELGSRDVNGTPRPLFADALLYVGVDRRPGPGVDVVAEADDWSPEPWLPFDLVVCAEVLEHAPHAGNICQMAHYLLRPGGLFLVTAAGPARDPHSVDGEEEVPEGEFYRNVSEGMLREWLAPFALVLTMPGRDGQDVYALAVKGTP
jgi:SAM-dependent methyltransferase